MTRKIGILGGSFNPVHVGHMMLAQYFAEFTNLDEVWLMLSPANPLKEHHTGATDAQRLEMLKIACANTRDITHCDVELHLPRPSYTATTLRHLSELHPDCEFTLIIGSDNWLIFNKWAETDYILTHHKLYIYPRPGYPVDESKLPESATLIADVPTANISSTFLRTALGERHNMSHFLPAGVYTYITKHQLYNDGKY